MGEQTCQVSNETCSFSESLLRPSWLGVVCYGVYSRMCEPLMYYFILDLTHFVLMACIGTANMETEQNLNTIQSNGILSIQ